jgi:pimeloyl-ACP methyl ester carboxylesterase
MMSQIVRKAVLIGINRYSDPRNNLKGCVNDALMMASILTENFQFNKEDIRLLVDERATTSNIRERLVWLTEAAAPGSVLVFHYSGHGSQVRDRSGDELEDGLDEILCPYDLDWDDPFTDDELRDAIKNVPSGVNFTLILDCCHSGTGTRGFFKEPDSRGPTPVSRYLTPPPDIGFRAAARIELDDRVVERSVNMVGVRSLKTRRFGMSVVEQRAILIAGCRSDQTSADAWIDNDYHGALSFSLHQSLKENRYSVSNRQLIEGCGNWLEAQRYEQIPQLEGPDEMLNWSFLGIDEHRPAAVTNAVKPLFSVGERVAKTGADTRVVFIHGIGDHAPGYSAQWRRVFNRYLSLPLDNYVEVLWDDLFDARTRAAIANTKALPALTSKEQATEAAVRDELRELFYSRQKLLRDIAQDTDPFRALPGTGVIERGADRGFLSWMINFDEYIGDFVKYLVSKKVRERVDERLESALGSLTEAGFPVVLISHSWGTVVAYNTLRKFADRTIELHTTLGSPLWMAPVRKILDFDGKRYACNRWINVDARFDIIGGELQDRYQVDQDYLVASVGGHPHSSYFHPDNQRVQRDIVATAVSEICG